MERRLTRRRPVRPQLKRDALGLSMDARSMARMGIRTSLILAPVAGVAAWLLTCWILGVIAQAVDPFEVHLGRTYLVSFVAALGVFVALGGLYRRFTASVSSRGATHIDHCALLYLMAAFFAWPLLTDNAGHLSHTLTFFLSLTLGAICGDALVLSFSTRPAVGTEA